MKRTTVPYIAATTLLAVIGLASPARANSIAITYSFAGAPTGATMVRTTLILDALSTGSIISGDPGLNAAWNPFTLTDHSVVDLTTGLLNGTFTFTFADGSTLFGNLFEDLTQTMMGVGPYTQTLTFTGGTREFAGATGSSSGAGVGTTSGFTVTGAGTINAPAVPEPTSAALLLGGLALLCIGWCRRTAKSSSISCCHL
jgi:hypothetical protein